MPRVPHTAEDSAPVGGDLASASEGEVRRLLRDETAAELAGELPFEDGEPVGVVKVDTAE